MKESLLTRDILKRILTYKSSDGTFRWNYRDDMSKSWNTRYAGKPAGSIRKERMTNYLYFCLRINGHAYCFYGHRLAWLYVYGEFPKNKIGHEDGNGLNNKIDNLTDITTAENNKNVKLRDENTSGFCGVGFHKASGKWITRIQVNNIIIHGGLFVNKNDAIEKRKQMNVEYGFHENHGLQYEACDIV